MNRVRKIAIAGAHSTGKSTFLDRVDARCRAANMRIGLVGSLAKRARDLGFPILKEHTLNSTLWLMAEGMRAEAELSLTCDVILVDRPPIDALAYLIAALEVTNRSVEPRHLSRLGLLARASSEDYDLMIVTELDRSMPLGPGRDSDLVYRSAVTAALNGLVSEHAPGTLRLARGQEADVLAAVAKTLFER